MAPLEDGKIPHHVSRVSNEVLEYKISVVADDVREIKDEYKGLRSFIDGRLNELERAAASKFEAFEQREKQWYKWALGALVWIITILVSVIWIYRTTIIGTMPGP